MVLQSPTKGWASLIERLLGEFGVEASSDLRRSFADYLEQVVIWGARMDLTAARSAEELVDLSLADAVIIGPRELDTPGAQHWVDVGSGGGAPGLPLFLFLGQSQGEWRGTLVEPRAKRTAFLRHCVGCLGPRWVDVVRARSDALPNQSFTRAIARATLPPEPWLTEGARLATEAVWVLVAREPPPQHPAWTLEHDVSYRWPLTGVSRRALRYVPKGRT